MTPVARNYSEAFLETAGSDEAVEKFLEAVQAVAHAVSEDRALRAFLAAPNIPLPTKSRALDEVARRAGVGDAGRKFLDVILRNGRIPRLGEILSGLSESLDARRGVVAAEVTVAAAIGDEERRGIEQALTRRTGRRVRMRVAVDPAVLAGFVARIGSEVFDASAAHAIERFRTGAREKAGT